MGIGPSARPTGLLEARPPAFSLLNVPGVRIDPSIGNRLLQPDAQGNPASRWLNSVQVQPEGCTVPLAIADAASGAFPYWWDAPGTTGVSAGTALTATTGGVKLAARNRANVTADPVTILAGELCSTLDLHDEERRGEVEARVRRKLAAILPAAVERELESGQIARLAGFSNHYLRDITTATQLTADLGYVTALAEIEQSLAENGVASGRRIIHAQSRVVSMWASAHLIDVSPDRTHLLTKLGTYVVPGTGYTGGAPGVDANSKGNSRASWAYGTGMVHVVLDIPQARELELNQASISSRTVNNAELRLEQSVAIVFDPCTHVAALVDLCDSNCGSGS